jgi:hypothetical protein
MSTKSSSVDAYPVVHWIEDGEARVARWRSEGGSPPVRVVIADDNLSADRAYGSRARAQRCCGGATSRMRAKCSLHWRRQADNLNTLAGDDPPECIRIFRVSIQKQYCLPRREPFRTSVTLRATCVIHELSG